jgi:hypothetical protein
LLLQVELSQGSGGEAVLRVPGHGAVEQAADRFEVSAVQVADGEAGEQVRVIWLQREAESKLAGSIGPAAQALVTGAEGQADAPVLGIVDE